MNTTNKTTLVIAFVIVVLLFLIFGGGTITGAAMNGGMMGSGSRGGIDWIWIPALIAAGLGILLGRFHDFLAADG